jgi:tetratricopeptide (TPR) repeat protein
MLFSQFITRDALDNLVEAFMKMLDDLTPYYQARMKELSNQQRKIVELLVDRRHPMMVKEIAADCFIDAGTAASQLRELRKLGYVEAEQNGRESFYELREVLMRLCLEVKKQRGQWVEIFVEFLKIWYPLSERKHQLELMRGTSQYIKDEHLERALLSDEDPCFIGSQRDLHRALKEQQQLLATETLEELFHSQRLTEENYQELVELVQSDQYSEAQKLLAEIFSQEDRSVEKSELPVSLQLLEGLELRNLEALELFDAVLAEDESDVKAWNFRGVTLDELGRHEEAIESFDRALSIKPDDYIAWNCKGRILARLEMYEEAIKSFDRALSIKPTYQNVWFNRGSILGRLGKYEEAIESFDRALSIKPDDYISWYRRGNSLYGLGRDEDAIASFDRAISIKPNDHETWYNRGISLHKLGKFEEAIASYDRAVSINPDDYKSWHNRGVSLRELERYEEAIASYDRAFSINPDEHQVIHNKGFTYFKWGKYVESIDYYNQAIAIKPDRSDYWHDKGLVQFFMGNYEDALNSWQQTFQIIQQLTPRPNDIAGLIQEFLEELIPRFSLPNSQPQISTFLTQLATIYQQAQVLPELSTALIATLPQLLAPNISDYTADEWLALWQNRLGTAPALEMPLRLMNVAIAYKKQPAQQKRLWLGLAKEEREILNGALELGAIPNSDSL